MKITTIISAAAILFSTSFAIAQEDDESSNTYQVATSSEDESSSLGNVFVQIKNAPSASTTDVEYTLTVTDTLLTETLKIKRRTDEASVELVRAFLDGVEVELQSDGEVVIVEVVAYSQSDDGMEEFTLKAFEETEPEAALHHLRKAYDLNPNDLSIKIELGRNAEEALPKNHNQLWGDWF